MTAAAADESTAPSFSFKRRKTAHKKRARTDDDALIGPTDSVLDATASNAPEAAQHEDDSVPNLKEILRNRKRPRERVKDVVRKPEAQHTELQQADARPTNQYTSRFVGQTGQVVDSSDAQM